MHRNAVSSTHHITSGYDPLRRIVELEYENGRIRAFKGVSPEEWAGYEAADSKGQYAIAVFQTKEGEYR